MLALKLFEWQIGSFQTLLVPELSFGRQEPQSLGLASLDLLFPIRYQREPPAQFVRLLGLWTVLQ